MRFTQGLVVVILCLVVSSSCISGPSTTSRNEGVSPYEVLAVTAYKDIKICVVNQSTNAFRFKLSGIYMGSVSISETRWITVPVGAWRRDISGITAVNSTGARDINPMGGIQLNLAHRWIWIIGNNHITNQTSLQPIQGLTPCD